MIVVGAGLAALVATAELVDAGRSVFLVDQEPEASAGGQAYWSFGGLFLVDSPEQRRVLICDSPELAWQDWLGSAGFDRPEDHWPRRWPDEARRYLPDRFTRIASPHRILDPGAGPLIAVRLSILTRKTLGGLETDLTGRVLRPGGEPLDGLYAAGEVAGFGGGGLHGYRSLEGLPGRLPVLGARGWARGGPRWADPPSQWSCAGIGAICGPRPTVATVRS